MARTAMARRRQAGTTTQRGYGLAHVKLRAAWKPKVDAGEAMCCAAICLKRSRQIQPGTPWHLGHTPDRTAWTGPEHEQCNEADGARRGNRMRGKRRAVVMVTSRRW